MILLKVSIFAKTIAQFLIISIMVLGRKVKILYMQIWKKSVWDVALNYCGHFDIINTIVENLIFEVKNLID